MIEERANFYKKILDLQKRMRLLSNPHLSEDPFDIEIKEAIQAILTRSVGTDLRMMKHKDNIEKIA